MLNPIFSHARKKPLAPVCGSTSFWVLLCVDATLFLYKLCGFQFVRMPVRVDATSFWSYQFVWMPRVYDLTSLCGCHEFLIIPVCVDATSFWSYQFVWMTNASDGVQFAPMDISGASLWFKQRLFTWHHGRFKAEYSQRHNKPNLSLLKTLPSPVKPYIALEITAFIKQLRWKMRSKMYEYQFVYICIHIHNFLYLWFKHLIPLFCTVHDIHCFTLIFQRPFM